MERERRTVIGVYSWKVVCKWVRNRFKVRTHFLLSQLPTTLPVCLRFPRHHLQRVGGAEVDDAMPWSWYTMHAHGLHASCLFQSSNTFPKRTYYPLPRPPHFTDDPPSWCIRDQRCSLTPYIVRIQTLNTRRRRFGVWKRVSFSLFTLLCSVGLSAVKGFYILICLTPERY